MKKWGPVVLVILALLAGVLVWKRCRGSTSESSGASTASGAAGSGEHAGAGAFPTGAGARSAARIPAWFAPAGAAQKRIAGRVMLDGKPAAGATVALHSPLTRARFAPVVEVTTDTKGAFDFGLVVPGGYQVVASSPNTVAAIEVVDLSDPGRKPPADQLLLELHTCANAVVGKVFDASGNMLPGVHVRRNGIAGVDTDAQGAYRLCAPYDRIEVEYAGDGYGGVTLTIGVRGETRRDVVLVPEAVLTVLAVRAEDNRPVADANVFVFPQGWAPDRPTPASAITGEDGRARIAGLLPGRYRASGYAEGLMVQGFSEVVAEVGAPHDVVVRLTATARITGVVKRDGQPVPGAVVTAVRTSPVGRSAPAFSGSDGTFTLERVPPGDLVFEAKPYEIESPKALHVEAGKTYEVTLDVRSLGAIRGTVSRGGKPVANVDVCCVRTPSNPEPQVRTDRDGHYEFLGVPAGTYSIGAGSDELGAFAIGGKVTLADAEQKTFDLELDMAGTIAGTVVDKQGKPVPGVFVRWIHQKSGDLGRGVTDAQGRYRCGAMTGGAVYVAGVFPSEELGVPYPTATGAPYPSVELKDGSTTIENIVIAIDRPDLAISGRVVDDAGKPVVDATVRALPTPQGAEPQFHTWLHLPMTSTDSDGSFRIADLAPGTYALQARAADGSEGVVPPVSAGANNVAIRIDRAGSIEGTLAGFPQPPVVYARPRGTYALIAGDVQGTTFRVGGLKPGTYVVNAQTTYEGDAQLVEVKAGQVAKPVLTAHGRGVIEGSVLDFKTKAPIRNAACHAVMRVGSEQTVTNWDLTSAPKSDATGKVLIDPAPAGDMTVTCDVMARRSNPSADVTLAAGARATVQLLSVEATQENGGSMGAHFDWRVSVPRVATVDPGSTGAKAGLLAGDLVTAVNGESTAGLNGAGVIFLIQNTPIGQDVTLTVSRGGATKTIVARMMPG